MYHFRLYFMGYRFSLFVFDIDVVQRWLGVVTRFAFDLGIVVLCLLERKFSIRGKRIVVHKIVGPLRRLHIAKIIFVFLPDNRYLVYLQLQTTLQWSFALIIRTLWRWLTFLIIINSCLQLFDFQLELTLSLYKLELLIHHLILLQILLLTHDLNLSLLFFEICCLLLQLQLYYLVCLLRVLKKLFQSGILIMHNFLLGLEKVQMLYQRGLERWSYLSSLF
jgi:hypothetical protein